MFMALIRLKGKGNSENIGKHKSYHRHGKKYKVRLVKLL